jgi:hypothetical protein
MIRSRAFALVALLLTRVTLTSAQTTTAAGDRAERLFREAGALAEQGHFEEACLKFEQSQLIEPALGTQFNLAVCETKIGKLGSAWRNLRAVEQLARAAGKRARAEAAQQMMEEIRARVTHLDFRADADVTVKVDGERVDRGDWGFYAVDPGDHVVEATAPTKKPWQTRVSVKDGGPATPGAALHVDVPHLELLMVTRETSNPGRTVGFVVGAVGLVGVAAGVATGVAVLGAKSKANDHCNSRCDAEGRDAVSTGKTLVAINWVSWGVAAAGLGVGTFLVLTSKPSSSQPSTAASVEPVVGPTSVSLRGRF